MAIHTLTPPTVVGNPPKEIPSLPVTRRTAFALGIGAAASGAAPGRNLSPDDDQVVSWWRTWRDAREASLAAMARAQDAWCALPMEARFPGVQHGGVTVLHEEQIDQLEAAADRSTRNASFAQLRCELMKARERAQRLEAAAGVPALFDAATEESRREDRARDSIEAVRSASPVVTAARLIMALAHAAPDDLRLDHPWSFVLPIARDLVDVLPLDMATALRHAAVGGSAQA